MHTTRRIGSATVLLIVVALLGATAVAAGQLARTLAPAAPPSEQTAPGPADAPTVNTAQDAPSAPLMQTSTNVSPSDPGSYTNATGMTVGAETQSTVDANASAQSSASHPGVTAPSRFADPDPDSPAANHPAGPIPVNFKFKPGTQQ